MPHLLEIRIQKNEDATYTITPTYRQSGKGRISAHRMAKKGAVLVEVMKELLKSLVARGDLKA